MKKLFKQLSIIFILIAMQISCSNTEKAVDISKYEDAETLQLFAPDISLKDRVVVIPKAKSISDWRSSGGVFSDVPQNILLRSHSKLLKANSYKLHAPFSRDYYFVGNTPVISGGKLFVLGDKSTVHAYNLSDLKKPKWVKTFRKTEEDFFRGGGLFATKRNLAVTYGSDSIKILDTNTGQEKWQYKMSNISKTAPIIYQDKVFALTVDNKLYCLDLTTGLLIWVNEGAAEQLGVIKASSLVVYKDFILVPYSVGQVYAVNITSGTQLWNLSLDEKFSSIGDLYTPVISDDIAYLSSFKGTLYALNLKTGNIEWNSHYAGGNPVWAAGDYIFSVSSNSQLSAINKFTGKVKWIQTLSNYTIASRPIIVNKKLFAPSSNGVLFVLSPYTGKKIRTISIDRGNYASPIATQRGLYLLSEKGNLVVFN